MPFDPLTWGIGFAAGKAATKFFDKLAGLTSKDELTRDLESAFQTWAGELPASAAVQPQTLATVLFSESDSDSCPARAALGAQLKAHELPTQDEWRAALMERWVEVASRGGELQDFFLLRPAEANAHLESLAAAIHRICRTDPKLFQNAVVDSLQELTRLVTSLTERLDRQAPSARDLEERMLAFSRVVLRYPTTLSARGEQIPRPELDVLLARLGESKWSSTVVLGERGSGKSALLATLAARVRDTGWALLAIKADLLQAAAAQALEQVAAGMTIEDAVLAVARTKKIVVVVDQIDAIAELLDRTTDRLNVVLNLVHRIAQFPNVHVVLSSREFEYRTDARLTSLDFGELRLELPPWSDIAAVLASRGYYPESMSEVLRALLRNPWTLKIFLSVARRGEHFSSLSALLDRVWSAEVAAGPRGREKVALLNAIAGWMIDNEDFVVPATIADTEPTALADLLSAAILVRDGGTLTFRHQTFFEFTAARRFGSGTADFLKHVLDRQDGLFVRPTIVTTLVLLRDTAPREYARMVNALLVDERVRLHVKILVIDFVASQREPLESERELLPRCLADETFGRRILDAIDPLAWDRAILECDHFRAWLRDPERAARCLPVLTQWVGDSALRRDVLRLVAHEWVPNRDLDPLLEKLLRAITAPDSVAMAMMDLLLLRSGLHGALAAVENKRRVAAAIAFDIEARLAEFEDEVAIDAKTARESLALFLWHYPVVVRPSAYFSPAEYLDVFWPLAVRCLAAIGDERKILMHLRDRKSLMTEWNANRRVDWFMSPIRWRSGFLDAVALAIETLNRRSTDDFLDFLRREGDSDVPGAHLLMDGALRAAAYYQPRNVLDYVLADSKRLRIHQPYEGNPPLAAIVLSRLDEEGKVNLQAALAALDPPLEYDVDPATVLPPPTSLPRLVLPQLPPVKESEYPITEKKRKASKRRKVPRPRSVPLPFMSLSDTALMGRINRELAKFNELQQGSEVPKTAVAGNIGEKLGAELAGDPDRVLRLLKRMSMKHETVVDALMMWLPRSLPAEQLLDTIVDLDARGFTRFRGGAAWHMWRRRDEMRIPVGMAEMLLRWLEETPPSPGVPPSQPESEQTEPPVQVRIPPFEPLVGGEYFLGVLRPRTSIFAALSDALLRRRVPAVATWRDAVMHEIGREPDLEFWQHVLRHLADVYPADPRTGDEVFRAIIDHHPKLLELPMTIWHIGRFFGNVEHSLSRDLFSRLRGLDAMTAKQGAFELLLSRADLNDADLTVVREAGATGDLPVLAGLGYGAVYAWSRPHRRAVAVELLSRVASAGEERFDDVLQRFLVDRQRDHAIDNDARTVLQAMVAHAALTRDTTAALLDLLQLHTVGSPDLVHSLTAALTTRIGTDFDDASRPFFVHAAAITAIAITLHRQPPFRAPGLVLFERLLELDAREAHAAIEMLDRRPGVRHSSVNWRRAPRLERHVSRGAKQMADA